MPEIVYSFAFFAVLIGVPALWKIFRNSITESWPTAPGRIESVNVIVENTRKGPNNKAEIAYSYEVAGEFYSGYFARLFWTEQKAWDFITPLKGREIMVHYKPGHPDKSALGNLAGT